MDSPTLLHQREFAAWAYTTSQSLLQTEIRLGLDLTSSLHHQAVLEELSFKLSHGKPLDQETMLDYQTQVHKSINLRRTTIFTAISNPNTVLLCGHVLNLDLKPSNTITERNLALGQSLLPRYEQAKSKWRECVLKRKDVQIWEALPGYLRNIVEKPGKFRGRGFEERWIETCKSPRFIKRKKRVLERLVEGARGWARVKWCACAAGQRVGGQGWVEGEWLGRMDGPSLRLMMEVNGGLVCGCRGCFLV